METGLKMEILPPLPANDDEGRFMPLDWLVIASTCSGVDDLILGNVEEFYVNLHDMDGRARIDALQSMSRMIMSRCAESFAQRVDAFFDAGFSSSQLKILCRSLATMQRTDGLQI